MLPPTPNSAWSLLFASTQKDSLISNTPAKRIVFIGGSNLSFGIDSQMIKDSLDINPINMGIQANIGLKYMLDDALPYIKEGDVIVIIPEYDQYYGDLVYGKSELFRLALDVDHNIFKTFNSNQWLMVVKNLAPFVGEKIYYKNYEINPNNLIYYSKNSFNEYGDVHSHWTTHNNRKAIPYKETDKDYNPETIQYIKEFEKKVPANAHVYISFPGYQSQSFENWKKQISQIENLIAESKIDTLGNPSRYKMDESYIFDTPYHLTEEGAKFRTKLLIEDLRKNRVFNR